MVGRPALLRALAGVVTGLALAGPVVAAPAGAAPRPAATPDDDGYDAPLAVTIDTLTPAVLPRTGPLTITGRVTNVDLETWSTIRLYPLLNVGSDCGTTCEPVMKTESTLAAAAASDPEAPVGVREPSVRYDVASLEPGQSTSYQLTIPQSVLRGLFPAPETGVYWLGVHALGASASTGNDNNADGRARTFLPYVPASQTASVPTAIVLPLRARIAHAEDGSLEDTAGWEDALQVDGELGGPLAFGAASGSDPLTWLVDPAVPDAVRALARGNPERDVAPRPDSEGASPSGEPSTSEDPDADVPDTDTPLARAARNWLNRAESLLATGTVAALPYGDPDVAAAADVLPSLYRSARELPGTELTAWDLDPVPVVAPPDGYLDASGIAAVDDDATLLLGQRMFSRERFGARPPVGGLIGERPVVVNATAAAAGGPGPDSPTAPVALRQRILSEAVIRLLRARGQQPDPLVVVLPASVSASGASEFWAALDLPWLDLTGLDDLPTASGTGGSDGDRQVDPEELTYPRSAEQAELGSGVLAEAGQLVRAGRAYQSILGSDYTVGTDLVGEALAGTSYAMRDDVGAAERLTRSKDWAQERLAAISIDAPSGVTLSGTSGSFNIAVRNDLDQPVTVEIAAGADSGARVRVANPIRLAPHSRTSVPVDAEMSRSGVHNITLRVTDTDGTPLGAVDTVPLRTGQVGVVIWVIIGSGAGILFVAIAIRLVRRFRHRGAEPDPVGETG